MLFTFEIRAPFICARGCQSCGTFCYHWWTASIKPKLLLSPFCLYRLRTFPFSQMNYINHGQIPSRLLNTGHISSNLFATPDISPPVFSPPLPQFCHPGHIPFVRHCTCVSIIIYYKSWYKSYKWFCHVFIYCIFLFWVFSVVKSDLFFVWLKL